MDVLFETVLNGTIIYTPQQNSQIPEIGSTVHLAGVTSKVADVEYFLGEICYICYEGETFRRNGGSCRWGINAKFKVKVVLEPITLEWSAEEFCSSYAWDLYDKKLIQFHTH